MIDTESKEVELKCFCKTCSKQCAHRCLVFDRYIEYEFNRCKYHSSIQPIYYKFKVQDNLEQIMAEEERRAKKKAGLYVQF